jgi:pimeloyl-ACP methyl ester carboxylesterase
MPTIQTGPGETIFYESPHVLGGAAPGARIIFIHGTGVDHRLFEDQLRFFAGAQTPIAIDLPGHGQTQSEALEDVVEYRSTLKAFVDNAHLAPVILCGHALGAAIALDYAVNHQREVEGLVLMDFGRTFPGAADSAADMLVDPTGYRQRNGRRGLREHANERAVELVTSARTNTPPNSAIRDLVAAAKWDASVRFPHVKSPTLLVYGENDPLLEQSSDLLSAMPSASLDTIPLARHFPHVEAPDIFNDSLNSFVTAISELTPITGGE